MAAIPEQNTAAQIGQAAQLKRYNDIPIDILPNDSFGRLYKPGTKTLGSKTLDEEKRASGVKEALAQKELDEMVRSNKADEAYKWAALNRGGGGGGGGNPSQATILNAIRNGAVQYAQNLTKGEPFQASRGLWKGQTFMSSGMDPQKAAESTVSMLQSKLGELPISSSNYNDIEKQIYVSLGLPVPTAKQGSNQSTADDLRAMLGL